MTLVHHLVTNWWIKLYYDFFFLSEADESLLSAETNSSSGLGKEDKPSKYRFIDSTKYYVVEEDVSDDEDKDNSFCRDEKSGKQTPSATSWRLFMAHKKI